jgi:hypothetical protein
MLSRVRSVRRCMPQMPLHRHHNPEACALGKVTAMKIRGLNGSQHRWPDDETGIYLRTPAGVHACINFGESGVKEILPDERSREVIEGLFVCAQTIDFRLSFKIRQHAVCWWQRTDAWRLPSWTHSAMRLVPLLHAVLHQRGHCARGALQLRCVTCKRVDS